MTTITPDLLAGLRRLAMLEKEHARPAWIDPDDVLALLDALHEARVAYLRLHQHDLQIACNEREALRARVNELENPRPLSPDDREALRNGGDR